MATTLWTHPAQIWGYVVEHDYRRERIAADFARTRRRKPNHRPPVTAPVRLPRPRTAEAEVTTVSSAAERR